MSRLPTAGLAQGCPGLSPACRIHLACRMVKPPSFLPALPRKGGCHRGRMGPCPGLEGIQTRKPPLEYLFWQASTNNWKDNIRETILAGHLSGHSMRTATGMIWVPGSQDSGTHIWSSSMTLRVSSVPDAWLESAGHHKSAEMSGRQSSLSGGHARWRQINLGSVLSLSGGQVLGPRVDCSGESGLCHGCSWGQGWAGKAHGSFETLEKERVVTRGGQGSGAPKRTKRRAFSCSAAGKKGHRRLYPDRRPALEIEVTSRKKEKAHVLLFLRRKHIIWGLQKWDTYV